MRLTDMLDALDDLVEEAGKKEKSPKKSGSAKKEGPYKRDDIPDNEAVQEHPESMEDKLAHDAGFANATAKHHRMMAKIHDGDSTKHAMHQALAHTALDAHDRALSQYQDLVGKSGQWIGHNKHYHNGQAHGHEHHTTPSHEHMKKAMEPEKSDKK